MADKMKIYIAGKITGDSNYKSKFKYIEELYNATGEYIVINPAVLPEGLTTAEYMKICFAMIDAADLVIFLPDYKESNGAMLELTYCEYISKNRIFI